MKNKQNTKVFILCVIFITAMISATFFSYKIITWYKDNNQNKKIMEQINEMIRIEHNDKYSIDISELYTINSECVGWIKVKGTDIEYPIVQTTNNEYYLSHTFDKSNNKAGWIFVDFRNVLDGSDKNIVIYGHNRKDGSMFGTLKNVLTKEWYNDKENKKIYLMLEDEMQEYEVFSAYRIEREEYYLTTQFDDEKEFEEFINEVKGRSIENFETNVSIHDKLLTLSTCADNNKYRVVVHAKKTNNSL